MKKIVVASLVIFFAVGSMLMASNHFTEIQTIKVEEYNSVNGTYEEGKTINDEDILNEIRSILNESTHKSSQHEMAYSATLRVSITYLNGKKEKLYMWEESGNLSKFTSSTEDGSYTINESKLSKTLSSLLK